MEKKVINRLLILSGFFLVLSALIFMVLSLVNMNDAFVDPYLVNVALSHMQFETIHAYKDGNGRLGRTLIPVHMSLLDESIPILYMSEILELYKPSYLRYLMACRRGNVVGYINFFLQCVIEQSNSYIFKLNKIKQIYKYDMEKIKEIKGNSIYRIMPVLMKQIVFTSKEVQELSGVSSSAVSRNLKKIDGTKYYCTRYKI